MATAAGTTTYTYLAGPFLTSALAQAACAAQSGGPELAIYPASAPLPDISGLNAAGLTTWLSAAQMPVAAACATLSSLFITAETAQQLWMTAGQCPTSAAVTGVLCQLPQL